MQQAPYRTLLAIIGVLGLSFPAAADFTLDSRYTDNDGDLIADIPADASQQVDPSTLIFAYTPVEDPAVYAEAWSDFLAHLEEKTGKKVQFFPVQSNAAQIEAMRAGRFAHRRIQHRIQPAGGGPAPASGPSPSWPLPMVPSATRWRS